MMQLLREIGGKTLKGSGHSHLAYLLLNRVVEHKTVWPALGQAYRSSRSPQDRDSVLDLLRCANASVIEKEDEPSQIERCNRVAVFCWMHVDEDIRRAARMVEDNNARIRSSKLLPDPRVGTCLLLETMHLGTLLMWQLILLQVSTFSPEFASTVKALKRLWEDGQVLYKAELDMDLEWKAFHPGLVYGHRIRRSQSDKDWKACFRKPALEYPDMLDDPNPQNDF